MIKTLFNRKAASRAVTSTLIIALLPCSFDGQPKHASRGSLYPFDISDPDNATQMWIRKVPRVPNPKGLVVDGERIIIHGIGLTEAWVDETKPAIYYQVSHIWKTLECVIPNGDLIYAFNGQGSVSKLMVLRFTRP